MSTFNFFFPEDQIISSTLMIKMEKKFLKRHIQQIGGQEEVKRLCNMKDRQYAMASLKSFHGIGDKTAERIIQEYRRDDAKNIAPNIFEYLRMYVNDKETLELLNTLRKKYDKLQNQNPDVDIYNREQFKKDSEVAEQEIAYMSEIVGENAEKMKKKYATYIIKVLTRREAQENKNRKRMKENKAVFPQPELKAKFIKEELRKTSYEILKRCKLSFKQIDELSLANNWWEVEGFQRTAAVIHESWINLTGENMTANLPETLKNKKCTACTPEQLLNVCGCLTFPPISNNILIDVLEELIEDNYYIAYENTEKKRVITSKKFFDLETDILDFVNYDDKDCKDSDYTTEEIYEYDEDGNLSKNQLYKLIDDAKKECIDSNITLTLEQIECILLILQNRFSLLNAIGGTGKTNVCAKIVEHIMRNLNYKVISVTPTHAAKKPILEAMPWLQVSTIASLNFDVGFGTGFARMFELCKDDEEKEMHGQKKRLLILMDESSMYGSQDLGTFFGQLLTYKHKFMCHVCMMGDIGQLTPVTPGVPFEDLVNSRLFASGRLTISHRAESKSLSYFCSIYRGDKCMDWTMNEQQNSSEYVLANETVKNIFCEKEEIQYAYARLLQQMKNEGLQSKNIMSITARNCKYPLEIRLVHVRRTIFDPDAEAERQKHVDRLKNPKYAESFEKGEWGLLTKGDDVCFTENTQWYKNGDETVIIDEKYEEYPTFVKHICFVKLKVDAIMHTLLQNIVKSKEEKTDFWHNFENIPKNMVELQTFYDEDGESISGGTWSISLPSQDLKPLSLITAHKSQGDQRKVVIFVAPYCAPFRDCRDYYTPCSRAQQKLYLIGPQHAFDNRHVKQRNPLPNTLLQTYCPNPTEFWKIDDLDTTEKMYVETVMTRFKKRIPKHLRNEVWKRDFGEQFHGQCAVCSCNLRFDSSDWHLCHIVARAVDESLAFDMTNMQIGCRTCNLKMHIRNLWDYKADFERKEAIKCIDTIEAKRIFDFVRNNKISYSEKTLYYKINQKEPFISKAAFDKIVNAYVLLNKIRKESINLPDRHPYNTLTCRS
tara:strand:+ start:13833 stop:16997 length:3165 start_codon:yes stop_codon:yes gene_type:complete